MIVLVFQRKAGEWPVAPGCPLVPRQASVSIGFSPTPSHHPSQTHLLQGYNTQATRKSRTQELRAWLHNRELPVFYGIFYETVKTVKSLGTCRAWTMVVVGGGCK